MGFWKNMHYLPFAIEKKKHCDSTISCNAFSFKIIYPTQEEIFYIKRKK